MLCLLLCTFDDCRVQECPGIWVCDAKYFRLDKQ